MAGVAAIGARQRFNPLNARMNYSHPLAKDLVFCGLPYLGVDLAKNRNAFTFTNARKAGMYGFACEVEWDANRTTDMEFTTGSFTIAIAQSVNNTANHTAFKRGTYTSETVNSGFQLYQHSTPASRFVIFANNGGTSYIQDAQRRVYHGTITGTGDGTTKRIYCDSRQEDSSTTGNQRPITTTGSVAINDGDTSTSLACAWNRVLSTNEIAMFTADPYCMLSY